ncbi:MAG: hypothetical protein HUJ69_06795 [Lachnospiraceae bacterium]|nr:hypothetical protein [Lachnospiraceae bacterium]
MRNFVRTLVGKVLFFILCIVTCCALVGSCILATIMTTRGFYSRSEEQLTAHFYESIVSSRAEQLIYKHIAGSQYNSLSVDEEISYLITNSDGQFVGGSAGYESVTDWQFTYQRTYYLFDDGYAFNLNPGIYINHDAASDIYLTTSGLKETLQSVYADEISYLNQFHNAEPPLAESSTEEAYLQDYSEGEIVYSEGDMEEMAAEEASGAGGEEESEAANRLDSISEESRSLSAGAEETAAQESEAYAYTDSNEAVDPSRIVTYTVQISPLVNDSPYGIFNIVSFLIHEAFQLRFMIFFIIIGLVLLEIVFFSVLMASAGRRPHDEELHPGPLGNIPFEFIIIPLLLFFALLWEVLAVVGSRISFALVLYPLLFLIMLMVLLGFSMNVAVRVKQRQLLKNTVVWRFFAMIGHTMQRVPLVWRTSIILVIISCFELAGILLAPHTDSLFFFWLLEKCILVPMILYFMSGLKELEKAGEALAKGDLHYQVNSKSLFPSLRKHANNLSSTGKGMSIAVENQLKSEHMQTELITNVSHDLKTPLTSLVNYASLISMEQTDNPRIKEYSAVLIRQSNKLKRLIEDLVEASRASTGTLDVELVPCNAGMLLSQALGEYEDKLMAADLTPILSVPEDDVFILADGRRMWRIFDNLMNNICKYAQGGTRAYLSLETYNGNAIITFRNTSKEALNIPEEKLMERFTRGDVSRTTEGNGLGLSIARSMTELQNGRLHISIDGDLFKATLVFPVIYLPETSEPKFGSEIPIADSQGRAPAEIP